MSPKRVSPAIYMEELERLRRDGPPPSDNSFLEEVKGELGSEEVTGKHVERYRSLSELERLEKAGREVLTLADKDNPETHPN